MPSKNDQRHKLVGSRYRAMNITARIPPINLVNYETVIACLLLYATHLEL